MSPTLKPGTLIVAGVMSGTSADGIDIALVRISPARQKSVAMPSEGHGFSRAIHLPTKYGASAPEGTAPFALQKTEPSQTPHPTIELLGHTAIPYSKAVRTAVLAAMDAPTTSAAELARLHTRLGQLYGDAILLAEQQHGVRADLCGVHGQTVYHQGAPARYLGKFLRCTWQLGETAETAALTGRPIIGDFRPADIAAGGNGAPLVPVLDRALYAHPTHNRILQNLGGIANLTALPAASTAVLAFDSGPANCLIDAAMQQLFGRRFDRDGKTAARGTVLKPVLDQALQHPYFAAPAPKSCGREQFGTTFLDRLLADCRAHHAADTDIVATLTALTAETILHSYRTLVWPFLGQHAPLADATDYIVAGGGARNLTLLAHLRRGLEPLGLTVHTSDDLGMPAQAKEAVAFALLAWLRWHNLPGNIPAATGATREVLLGKVTLP